jgi:hypothetical protein
MYLASIEHAREDREFLQELESKSQSQIARERGVQRQAINQQVAKARKRLAFLAANPLPPLPTSLIQQTQTADRIPA